MLLASDRPGFIGESFGLRLRALGGGRTRNKLIQLLRRNDILLSVGIRLDAWRMLNDGSRFLLVQRHLEGKQFLGFCHACCWVDCGRHPADLHVAYPPEPHTCTTNKELQLKNMRLYLLACSCSPS